MMMVTTDEQRRSVRDFFAFLEQQLAQARNAANDARDDGEDASSIDQTVARFQRAIEAVRELPVR